MLFEERGAFQERPKDRQSRGPGTSHGRLVRKVRGGEPHRLIDESNACVLLMFACSPIFVPLSSQRLTPSNYPCLFSALRLRRAFPVLPMSEDGCEIWGVVTHSIRRHCGR